MWNPAGTKLLDGILAKPLSFAGLWERLKDPEGGDEIRSFTILTTEPNDFMAEIHNRMPVIFGPREFTA